MYLPTSILYSLQKDAKVKSVLVKINLILTYFLKYSLENKKCWPKAQILKHNLLNIFTNTVNMIFKTKKIKMMQNKCPSLFIII